MTYRHYLTVRFEGPRGEHGYVSINGDGDAPRMTDETLLDVLDTVRVSAAHGCSCAPSTIKLYIVNHLAVTV